MEIYYEDEKITVKEDIICFILSILCLYGMLAIYAEFLSGNFGIGIFLLVELIFLLFAGAFGYVGLANIINAKYNRGLARKIINNGIKVQGKIICIETVYKRNNKDSLFRKALFARRKVVEVGNDKTRPYYDYAKVEYEYNGTTYDINTPYIFFYPNDLINNNVDVYIYDDMCYVDNFKIDNEKIASSNNKQKKFYLSIIISFLVVVFLIVLSFYLSSINVINVQSAFRNFKVCVGLYIVIVTMLCLRYISSKD